MWTKKQKTTAVIACKAARISDEHRKLILRQFWNAMFDAHGNQSDAPSSTSSRLTNADFECFMAIVERTAGGRLALPSHSYAAGHWQSKADDRCQRMRHLANAIATALDRAGRLDAAGLFTWIRKYVSQGEDRTVDQLSYHELHSLINGLRAYARRNGVAWDEQAESLEPAEAEA